MKAGQAACSSDYVDGCSDAYSTALRLVPKELAAHLSMFKHRIELELGAACYRAKRPREAIEHLRTSAALGEPGGGSTLRAMYTLGQALEALAHVTGGGWLRNDDATRAIEAYESVVASDGFARGEFCGALVIEIAEIAADRARHGLELQGSAVRQDGKSASSTAASRRTAATPSRLRVPRGCSSWGSGCRPRSPRPTRGCACSTRT